LQKNTVLNKGLGRSSLLKQLINSGVTDLPDHKLRSLINMLTDLNFVQSGKTKQGTKITSLGTSFLDYLEQ